MGVNNKKRRAAKQRKQERERRSAGPGAAAASDRPSWDADAAVDLVEARLRAAVRRLGGHRLADSDLHAAVERLMASVAPHPRHVVEIVIGDVVFRLTDAVVSRGWTPGDLVELVRRNLGPSHLPTLLAVLQEDDRAHDRGQAWSSAVDAVKDGSDALPVGTTAALASSLGLTVLLAHAPQLADTFAAAPGGAASEHPKLARVRALLAKAESTEFDREAEALSAKAQELITRYALERLVGQTTGSDDHAPGVRRLWLDPPYVGAKASLVAAVARANRCRVASAERLGFCVVVGAPGDLDAVELLVTSLVVQADVAMLHHERRFGRGSNARTRSFRQSFLMAYAFRVGERLRAASSVAISGDLLPVLRSHDARVAEAFDRMVPHTVGRAASISNGDGWAAGLAAGDLAVLDARTHIQGAG